ncbi:MAG: DUF4346 domain-containing protein [Anaerolineales bacterium]
MDDRSDLDIALSELETGIDLPKCQQCGCMRDALEHISSALPTHSGERTKALHTSLPGWVENMKPIRYACLGCEHCYAGAAENAFSAAFPDTYNQIGLSCEMQTNAAGWPPVVGEYVVLDPSAPVAVTTLASADFSIQLADQRIPGLAIVGKLETENIGIDKIIKNTIANPKLRFLIVAGTEPKGHLSGQTLLALAENGVDENRRVIGSKGKRPVLRNVTQMEIEAFRQQIQVFDLIDCECIDCVQDKIAELCHQVVAFAPQAASCGCADGSCHESSLEIDKVPAVFIDETNQPVKLDKAGYFVIFPVAERKTIHVEHYNYDNLLLHVIEGASARSLYLEIIDQNWVSEMSHAAYLGKELAKAELSLATGTAYNQDAA